MLEDLPSLIEQGKLVRSLEQLEKDLEVAVADCDIERMSRLKISADLIRNLLNWRKRHSK